MNNICQVKMQKYSQFFNQFDPFKSFVFNLRS